MSNIKKNDIFQCEIVDVSSSGEGIAKLDGFTIFIPMTVSGDVARIKIVKVLKNYGYGILQDLISGSSHRIPVDCESFNRCGGCAFRHISYDFELQLKRNFIRNAFNKIANLNDIDVCSVIPSKFVERYRNKAIYPIGRGDKGDIIAGFYSKRSHNIIACNDCKLHPQLFDEILKDIINFLTINNITIYNELLNQGIVRNVYIRQGFSTNQLLVTLVVTEFSIDYTHLINILTSKYSNIKGIVLNLNNKNTNVVLGDCSKVIYGSDHIYDQLCCKNFKLSVNSFYQVNSYQAENLYYKIAEILRSYSGMCSLLDLYCGAGTIALILSDHFESVTGIEIVANAFQDALFNAELNNIKNATFVCDDVSNCSNNLQDNKSHVVVVDPPRKGCSPQVLEYILKSKPKVVFMISCNPSTLARDCRYLIDNNYKIDSVIPFDMFPRTTHVECLVVMSII